MSSSGQLIQKAQDSLLAAKKLLEAIQHGLAEACAVEGKLSMKKMDERQLPLFEWAGLVAEVTAANALLQHAKRFPGDEKGLSLEEKLAVTFAAEAVQRAGNLVRNREAEFGLDPGIALATMETTKITAFLAEGLQAHWHGEIAVQLQESPEGRLGLGEDLEMMRQTFRDFAEGEVRPLAEKVHRHDDLIPEKIIKGLGELGCFGLSIPEEYGGFHTEESGGNLGMCLVTEELSRASLGVAGSLITRPEILAKALLKGGTPEQKKKWLPIIAEGKKMVAVAVTEPDFGSDVAGVKVTATPAEGGWKLNGCKTWCTFAGRADIMLVLARTNPDFSQGYKGLSMFIAEKPPFEGHEFDYKQPNGGRVHGRAIDTIGYRGMHSFEVVYEDYFAPADNLIGGEKGLGRGFYLQMEGFAGGRLQTAARANGVMRAAFEKALQYSLERKVFGQPIFTYSLTKYKLSRMAAIISASRQLSYEVARLFDQGKGLMEGSLVKMYASRMAEWVAREAMQIHGGMGYAEEYDVSRYFVDARVFSIFEGAEEVLALRVVARTLLEEALGGK